VRITKVVLFSTMNPTKLDLHFSELSKIFYTFYKFQKFPNTIGDILLRGGPWKYLTPCNVAMAMEGGGTDPNSVAPVTESAGEGGERG
jgi:hypothetical protein